MSTISRKICLVGDFGVGKTSFIRQFVDRQFSDQYLSTVGVKISRKTVSLEPSADSLQLVIWDIEGSNQFKSIAPSYLQGAKGAILVCDVTRPPTLQNLSEHIKQFLDINPSSKIIVAINKTDLMDEEQVERLLESSIFSNQPGIIAPYATSAKTGKNVDVIFQTLSAAIAH
jgi:small GTP-binding protein